jgi:large subunit ribosomal protein L30
MANKKSDKQLKITLVKSLIGQVPKNRAIAESMGLRKIGKTVILPDNDATKGQIRLINHLIKVEEV